MKQWFKLVSLPWVVACGSVTPGHPTVDESPPAYVTQAASQPQFPLRVSANSRYLVDQSGSPFRLQIDAAWVMVAHASDADVATYLSSIKALGFNGFILMNIVHAGGPGWPNLHEPADYYGNQPFLVPEQLDTPNDAYFARVSSVIDQALALGLAVELFHTYVGGDGGADGWEAALTNSHNTDAVCFNWGVYLARKFTQPNIIWMHGGDHTLTGTALSRFKQVVAGIQSVSRNRIAGSEWTGPDSILIDQPGFSYGPDAATSDMQLDSFYGGGPNANGRTYITAERAYSSLPTLPASLEEPGYVDAWYYALNSRSQIRGQYHWAQTAGATAGGVFGEAQRWDWRSGALASLSRASTLDMSYSHAFYQSIPWYLLQPSGTGPGHAGRTLIVAGAGANDSVITSAITSTGSHLIAYVPPTGTSPSTFSVDLRSMAGSSRARWWNPTNGSFRDATGASYTLPNTVAAQQFTSPGDNGTGTNDWMLTLDVGGSGGSGSGGAGSGGSGTGGAARGGASSGGSGAGGAGTGGAGNGGSGTGGAGRGGAGYGGSGTGGAGSGGTVSASGGVGNPSDQQTIIIGDAAVLPIDDASNAGLVVAQLATLPRAATVAQLSFYVTNAAGRLRLGIYDASGRSGNPGVKVAESAEIVPVVGWNTVNVTSTSVLPAGNYWLAYAPSSNDLHFRRTESGQCRYFARAYGALPTKFSTSPTSLVDHWSFYATLSPQ